MLTLAAEANLINNPTYKIPLIQKHNLKANCWLIHKEYKNLHIYLEKTDKILLRNKKKFHLFQNPQVCHNISQKMKKYHKNINDRKLILKFHRNKLIIEDIQEKNKGEKVEI